MRFTVGIASLALVVVGCRHDVAPEQSSDPPPSQAGTLAPVADVSPDQRIAPSIECIPEEFAAGDTLVLRLSHPHGSYLAVTAPDGTMFFLAYPSLGGTSGPSPWLTSEEFARTSEVTLPTASVKVAPWEANSPLPRSVFDQKGNYQITVSENLETDMEDVPQANCQVRLR